VRGNVGDISKPYFIPMLCSEILLEHVSPGSIRMFPVVIFIGSSCTFRIQTHRTHERYDSFSIDLDPLIL